MHSEHLDELYSHIKKTGTKAEALVNEWIKDRLNKEDVVEGLCKRTKWYAKLMKEMQDAVEIASIPLNIPTKKDVASVAKLTIQNEERLEEIQQRLIKIEKTLARIEAKTHGKTPSEPAPKRKSARNTQDRKERSKIVHEHLQQLTIALLNQSKLGD